VIGAKGSGIAGLAAGEAYVFERQGASGWVETRRLFGHDTGMPGELGTWVAIDESTILTGAPVDVTAGSYSGAAYFFEPTLGDDLICHGLPNSTGGSGDLAVVGRLDAAEERLILSVHQCPRDSLGIFLMGDGVAGFPLGDGELCLSGRIVRLAVVPSGASGVATHVLDFSQPSVVGQLLSGTTHAFQYFYRDAAGGTSRFNLSSAVQVTLD